MGNRKYFIEEEAKRIGEELGIDWSKFDVRQFFPGIDLEMEEIKPIDTSFLRSTSQYSAVRNTKIGIFWLKIKKWLGL